ncbi:SIR2-like protein [Nitrosomonas sp. Nm84]|uniref:toll/interleukin-1 receptor domain-containing protein n=1 Tax=Nitrosomonas sp. Nm84 TaxID=200124 RepID=UPI000D75B267|nr:toll/interleukin-1 receptor domain-containing protein [Nitrosomonas sp. Nm84]PXW88906.1 SIR2-like protein [Nitrosomonas sp. Nm84]
MNAVLSTDEEDRLWPELIRFVREGALIPITGSELLEIPSAAGGTKNFYTLVAEELALRLKVDPPQHTGERALNEVACGYLANRRNRAEELYPVVKEVVEELEQSVPIPKALNDLAALPVKLFVTTTFDNLLVRAIEQRHPAWAGRVRQIEYSPVRKDDLDSTQLSDGPPVVFHLFGRATSMPEYAVTEEDVLEFMHALQSQEGRPEKLFRLLQQKNLLIVGCGFVDWLARFFIRLGVSTRLSAAGGKTDWFIERASSTSEFAVFLDHFGRSTKHFSRGPVEFIARFAEKLPRDLTLTPAPRAPAARRDPERDILEGALFLSYASEDRAIVERIQQALGEDIECWFDRQQLIGGDDWESKIIRNVNACSLFVLILSRHTLTQQDRFFRHEWHEAFKRSIGFAANARFLIPVVIDDIQPNNPALPLELRKPNWERLPAGEVTPAFRESITTAFQQAQLRARGSAT